MKLSNRVGLKNFNFKGRLKFYFKGRLKVSIEVATTNVVTESSGHSVTNAFVIIEKLALKVFFFFFVMLVSDKSITIFSKSSINAIINEWSIVGGIVYCLILSLFWIATLSHIFCKEQCRVKLQKIQLKLMINNYKD